MKFSKLIIVALLVSAFSAYATDSSLNEATYSLINDGISQTVNPDASNGKSVIVNGEAIYIGVTGWSDTGGAGNDLVVQGTNSSALKKWNATWSNGVVTSGYGIQNDDNGDSHAIDNYNDFDMILLAFSEEVTLTDASFNWLKGDNGNKEITVAGLDLDSSSPFLSNDSFTWSDAASHAVEGAIGHFGIANTAENYYFNSTFSNLSSAKYWLVGAYNTYFADSNKIENNIKLKLSGIGFTTETDATTPPPAPTPVSEPGALALMSIGLGLLAYRRKRRV
ncbi:exosortase-dependent surface protein XDP1 [Alteromonas sp. CI.11.F.A3]|uniref:exosortase-dependent surface protein XDP1 n=1 Tax=Alteromonas sp. CI.11.F.A3 TaxID=3079555 RepID=UPI0029437625|nr:exosortase-dependent surface protein XDP1 [Alteromonas sp. CI.11.F.A3]WOI38901.1 exosortase-dependent surface protein XDP1 [Alteromonas sp. CI.11.F.A3]